MAMYSAFCGTDRDWRGWSTSGYSRFRVVQPNWSTGTEYGRPMDGICLHAKKVSFMHLDKLESIISQPMLLYTQCTGNIVVKGFISNSTNIEFFGNYCWLSKFEFKIIFGYLNLF